MNDFIYEDIAVNSRTRNMTLGLYMKNHVYKGERVNIYESEGFGNCLYIDGALQATESDEFYYHETLAHCTMVQAPQIRNILIIGGGDGGTLREVLKHKDRGIQKITLCEINARVIEACKLHFNTMLSLNLLDPLVELVIEDGNKFLDKEAQYDIIIVDCNDPSPESNALYSREFIEKAFSKLTLGGIFAIQAGNVFIKEEFCRLLRYELKRRYTRVAYWYAPVPTYPSGGIGFFICQNNPESKFYCDLSKLETKYFSHFGMVAGMTSQPKAFSQYRRHESLNWYANNYYDFHQSLTQLERALIHRFYLLEDEPNHSEHPLFSFSQARNTAGDVLHAVRFLTLDGVERIEDAVQAVLLDRKLQTVVDLPINGFALHSHSDIFELHYVTNVEQIRRLAPELLVNKPEHHFDDVVLSQFFSKGKSYFGATYSDLGYDTAIWQNEAGGTELGVANRVRTNISLWQSKLNAESQETVDSFLRKGFKFDRIQWKDRDNHTYRFKL